jgi:hypothetical protein
MTQITRFAARADAVQQCKSMNTIYMAAPREISRGLNAPLDPTECYCYTYEWSDGTWGCPIDDHIRTLEGQALVGSPPGTISLASEVAIGAITATSVDRVDCMP